MRTAIRGASIYNAKGKREASGGIHAFFLILGEPETPTNLPPAPEVPPLFSAAWTSAVKYQTAFFSRLLLAFVIETVTCEFFIESQICASQNRAVSPA